MLPIRICGFGQAVTESAGIAEPEPAGAVRRRDLIRTTAGAGGIVLELRPIRRMEAVREGSQAQGRQYKLPIASAATAHHTHPVYNPQIVWQGHRHWRIIPALDRYVSQA